MYARYRTHTSINDKKMITTRKKKNDFAGVFKNLATYKSENNFIVLSKQLFRKFKHDEQCYKKF